ncbi:MAG: SseB family protein [Candidatus Dormibacteria bacterium]
MEPLEVAITLKGDSPDAVDAVRTELGKADVFCLGQPAGHMATSQQGSESDLLHFTIHDAEGAERVMLPVFTQPEIMRAALARNPDWQTLSVLQVQGQGLLDHVHPDVIIVINPWSRLEFQLPPAPRAAG